MLDQAIRQARDFVSNVTAIPRTALSRPVVVFRITDKVTSRTRNVRGVVAGVEVMHEKYEILPDWQLLIRLNELLAKCTLRRDSSMPRPSDADQCGAFVESARKLIESQIREFDLPFDVPELHLLAVLWPSVVDSPETAELGEEELA